MPRGESRSRAPRDYLLSGIWPGGLMAEHHGAKVAQALAVRLVAAMEAGGWSVAELSRASGVSRLTITQCARGETWCDLLTIANLELALGVDLWPGREP